MGPGRIFGDLCEEPKHLRVAGWAVAPTDAVSLDQVGPVRWVRVRDEKALRTCLVAAYNVCCSREGKIDQVLSTC